MLLVIRGGPALTPFRLTRLLASVRAVLPAVRAVHADHRWFVKRKAPLREAEHAGLVGLLRGDESEPPARSDQGTALLVTPRVGTISPWSTKATEIAHACGLTAVSRIERGVAYTLEADQPLTAEERALATPLLHDRMTESVLDDIVQAERLFLTDAPAPLRRIPVLRGGAAALIEADRMLGLALAASEVDWLVNVYVPMGRDPTDAELMMFAQANSEHCRHKIFNATFDIDSEVQSHSLFAMIRNTFAQSEARWAEHGDKAAVGRVLSAYRDNAAVFAGFPGRPFAVDPETGAYASSPVRPVHVLIKVETHNHPTAVSPFPGAATGTGGEIRDEGATGRGGKPKAGMAGFTTSHLRLPELPQPWEAFDLGVPDRIATPLQIMLEAPIGAASYANEFGRPNLCGYFRTFELPVDGTQLRGYHKPIMIAGGYGNIAQEHVEKLPIPENAALVVLGGPAMRIGLGGGAASSMASGQSTEALDFASVQRANPEMERRCQEVIDRCIAMGEHNPLLSVHDVGAGGLSNAFPELVHGGGVGGHFDLRAIPSTEPGMSPLEIWCNEAQERYVLAVAEDDLATFAAICTRERCPFAVVGRTTALPNLRVDDPHFGEPPVDIPLDVILGKAPKMHRSATRFVDLMADPGIPAVSPMEAALRVLAFPAVADKTFLVTIGDRSITGMVARDPMVGPWQVPVADVAVTTATYKETTGEAMAIGERTPIAVIDAAASARMAVGEAVTNLLASRFERIEQVSLSLNWMAAADHGSDDADLYDAVEAVGMGLCPALGIAVPVGKDSLSMRTRWTVDGIIREVIAPISVIATAFAPVLDTTRTLTPELTQDKGETVLLLIDLGNGRNRMGASVLAQVYGVLGGDPPDVDDPRTLRALVAAVQALNAAGLVLAYHDRSDGGLFATLCEMAFCSRCGLDVQLPGSPGTDPLSLLFNEELGAVLQVRAADLHAVAQLIDAHGLAEMTHAIGRPTNGSFIRITHAPTSGAPSGQIPVISAPREVLHQAWSETSFRMTSLRDEPASAKSAYDGLLDNEDSGLLARLTFDPGHDPTVTYVGRPPIAILRDQGVNGQLEMAAAFERAGFLPVDVHMSDLVDGRHTLEGFAGLVACGGFSYGDVLGAGAGWAKSILMSERLRDAFAAYFARPDTFALGVCNGCQMLSLLQDIIPGSTGWPRFVRNRSEQFEARLVSMRIEPSPSLFFAGMAGSCLLVPVAHGEGQAHFANEADHDALVVRGLVAGRYVDALGRIAERYPANPSGTPGGMAALTTGDGRVTVLMPHPERVFRWHTLSWCPPDWRLPSGDSPWMRMFRNARAAMG